MVTLLKEEINGNSRAYKWLFNIILERQCLHCSLYARVRHCSEEKMALIEIPFWFSVVYLMTVQISTSVWQWWNKCLRDGLCHFLFSRETHCVVEFCIKTGWSWGKPGKADWVRKTKSFGNTVLGEQKVSTTTYKIKLFIGAEAVFQLYSNYLYQQ